MTVQIIGQNNGGVTNNFVSDDILICPTSLSPSGTDPRIRKLVFHARPSSINIDYVVYESATDDLTTATPLHTGSVPRYDTYNSPQEFLFEFDLDLALNPANFYWIGLKFPGGAATYVSSGGGVNFVRLDSFNVGVSEDWPSPAGAFTASGEKLNFYAEIVDRGSKLTTTIGTSPDTSDNSLLRLDAKYQLQNAQIRYDEYSENLNAVTVFDDGRFLIDGYDSDSFEIELAEPSSSFDAPVTIAVTDISKDTTGLTTFGSAALLVVAQDGVIEGNTVTVSTDGAFDFGTKAQAAATLFDLGDTVYVNGVEDTSNASTLDGAALPEEPTNAIYEQMTGNVIARRTGLRHANATMHYGAGSDSSWVGKPYGFKSNTSAFGGYDRTPQVDKLYLNWFFKPQYKVNSYGEVAITNKVGTFETKDGLFAEDLIVTNAGGGGVAYMKLIENFNDGTEKIAFEADRTSADGVGSTELTGASITGAISGATADLDPGSFVLSFGGSSKFVRIWDNQDGEGGDGPEPDVGARISWTNGQLTTGGSIDNTNTHLNSDEWNQLEILVDLTTMNVKRKVNNQLLTDYTITGVTRSPLSSANNEGNPVMALLGWDGKQTRHLPEFGEIYQDITPQRVVVGNASTWEECTLAEPQILLSWSSTNIQFKFRAGATTNDRWLYVIGTDGEPINTLGVRI